jgi:SAM-dependent methyltransferase
MILSPSLRRYLKRFIPSPILQLREFRRRQLAEKGFKHYVATNANRSLKDIFNDIYEKNYWGSTSDGSKFFSGPGSMSHATNGYENFVVSYIEQTPNIVRIVDIGCGDFQVADRILKRLTRPVTYVGCDVASKVIEHNTLTHTRPGVSFQHLDASTDPLPSGDLVMIREVLQHLSQPIILSILKQIKNAYPNAIITDSVAKNATNINNDLPSGVFSRDGYGNAGNFFELPPYNLHVLDSYCYDRGATEIRTLRIDLRKS